VWLVLVCGPSTRHSELTAASMRCPGPRRPGPQALSAVPPASGGVGLLLGWHSELRAALAAASGCARGELRGGSGEDGGAHMAGAEAEARAASRAGSSATERQLTHRTSQCPSSPPPPLFPTAPQPRGSAAGGGDGRAVAAVADLDRAAQGGRGGGRGGSGARRPGGGGRGRGGGPAASAAALRAVGSQGGGAAAAVPQRLPLRRPLPVPGRAQRRDGYARPRNLPARAALRSPHAHGVMRRVRHGSVRTPPAHRLCRLSKRPAWPPPAAEAGSAAAPGLAPRRRRGGRLPRLALDTDALAAAVAFLEAHPGNLFGRWDLG
jgi:hypothetical protein